jgi:predicted transcriptional regulator
MARSGGKKEIIEVKANNMTVRQIAEELDLRVYTGKCDLDVTASGGYVSDLLSDVMGNAREGEVWITLQSHLNVVAIASLKELAAIVLVKGIEPDEQVIRKASEEGIPILGTSKETFETTGKLFQILKR